MTFAPKRSLEVVLLKLLLKDRGGLGHDDGSSTTTVGGAHTVFG
jgi:hypothetical protein